MVYQNVLKLMFWPFAFTLHAAFLKHKNKSGTSLSASFLDDFWKKIMLCYDLLND